MPDEIDALRETLRTTYYQAYRTGKWYNYFQKIWGATTTDIYIETCESHIVYAVDDLTRSRAALTDSYSPGNITPIEALEQLKLQLGALLAAHPNAATEINDLITEVDPAITSINDGIAATDKFLEEAWGTWTEETRRLFVEALSTRTEEAFRLFIDAWEWTEEARRLFVDAVMKIIDACFPTSDFHNRCNDLLTELEEPTTGPGEPLIELEEPVIEPREPAPSKKVPWILLGGIAAAGIAACLIKRQV